MKIRWEISVNLLFAMFSCLIVIAVMRWVARPLVWLSILGVLTMLGFGKYKFNLPEIALRHFFITKIKAMIFNPQIQEHTTHSSNIRI